MSEKLKTESISNSVGLDCDSDDDKPLIHFVSDRVQIMKIIFKYISSKRITQMAPKFLKEMPTSVMKSVLLDELMGISNKRLTLIINNTNDPTKSSSSSEEEPIAESKPDDIISLDDISDDSVIIEDNYVERKLSEQQKLELAFGTRQNGHKRKHKKTKHSKKAKVKVKQESDAEMRKSDIDEDEEIEKQVKTTEPNQNDPFVSALNLLELQARARAIRSQLLNEITVDKRPTNESENHNNVETKIESHSGTSSPNSVLILSPEHDIVEIDESSHSGNDETLENGNEGICNGSEEEHAQVDTTQEASRDKFEHCENPVNSKSNEQVPSLELGKKTPSPEATRENIETVEKSELGENVSSSCPDSCEQTPAASNQSENVDKLKSVFEEDNDVLIMNEDEDILL